MDKPDRFGKDDPANPRGAGKTPATPPPPGGGAEAYARWIEHMQRSRGRHAAITRNLYTWSNYKSWTEKVKNSWDPEPTK
jgi:hypothetical protein